MTNLLSQAGGPIRITNVSARDVRFPTSRSLDGSDAMNKAPDYSAAYVVIETDHGPSGHGFTFTIGRGNEVCVAAIHALAPLVKGLTLDELFADMGAMWRKLTGDSQLRWLGPDKGAIHLATSAVANALWDLYARLHEKPVWQVLAEMEPEAIVGLVDWRYLKDALDPAQALERLQDRQNGRAGRMATMRADGYPAYTTSAGWLGYSDEKLKGLIRKAIADGWTHFKMKVGGDPADDLRRAGLIRDEIGPDRTLMMDANQVWGANEAIERMAPLAAFDPLWIEEPTSPDDILGHARIARAVAPVGVATGEHCHNAVMFKQFLQAQALSYCQIDAGRLAGPNEMIAVLLLADRFGVPVCPHAGGVGLCEMVQHIALFDYIAVSGTLEGRVLEYVDHLHEHFVDPVTMRNGRYMPPEAPGYSTEMKRTSIDDHSFPDGPVWRSETH
ncbi:MAG: L-fuconate dehydratase [Roseitalea sp.]|jgi:L-fuconate dehydratase|nr:L-fuconate dehydratase [Roseitalea sp.]MBO6721506.1 L-fuconate dehydratase [Roseitalea sp.]MBO6742063.1 L-fuconate dehydratase [Roseitalea sp.]